METHGTLWNPHKVYQHHQEHVLGHAMQRTLPGMRTRKIQSTHWRETGLPAFPFPLPSATPGTSVPPPTATPGTSASPPSATPGTSSKVTKTKRSRRSTAPVPQKRCKPKGKSALIFNRGKQLYVHVCVCMCVCVCEMRRA